MHVCMCVCLFVFNDALNFMQAKQELEAEYSKMMSEAKTNLEKDHQKAMTEVESQYKAIRATEEDKLKHQQSLQSMEEDMETELAAKKSKIEQLHQQQLDNLKAELEEKLSIIQQDHEQQEAKERETFSSKLEQLSKQLETVKAYSNTNSYVPHREIFNLLWIQWTWYSLVG